MKNYKLIFNSNTGLTALFSNKNERITFAKLGTKEIPRNEDLYSRIKIHLKGETQLHNTLIEFLQNEVDTSDVEVIGATYNYEQIHSCVNLLLDTPEEITSYKDLLSKLKDDKQGEIVEALYTMTNHTFFSLNCYCTKEVSNQLKLI